MRTAIRLGGLCCFCVTRPADGDDDLCAECRNVGRGGSMSEMKAGPELDARLCELLEEKPASIFEESSFFKPPSLSPSGFWRRTTDWRQWSTWQPIPVSTDWAAAGKVAGALTEAKIDINMRQVAATCPDKPIWRVWLTWRWPHVLVHRRGQSEAKADKLPHALALAAIEALEQRKEKVDED